MANESGMKIDFDDFNKKFFKLTIKDMPNWYVQAVGQVLGDILSDAITIIPMAPHKTGHMIRSQTIDLPRWVGKILDAKFGFDTPYAAKLHEAPTNWNWTLPGSGPKYLESKLVRFKNKYVMKITELVASKGTGKDI